MTRYLNKVGCSCCSTERWNIQIFIFLTTTNFLMCVLEFLTENWDIAINCTITYNMKVLLNEAPMISVVAIMNKLQLQIEPKLPGLWKQKYYRVVSWRWHNNIFSTQITVFHQNWREVTNSAPILTIQILQCFLYFLL